MMTRKLPILQLKNRHVRSFGGWVCLLTTVIVNRSFVQLETIFKIKICPIAKKGCQGRYKVLRKTK